VRDGDWAFRDQAHMEERCSYWQKVLRVQDWSVRVRQLRANQMPLGDGGGEPPRACVNMTLARRCALVSLMDPIDWDQACHWSHDQEVFLVHELLHLVLEPIDAAFADADQQAYDNAYTQREQLITSLDRALVALDRARDQNIPLPLFTS
jgi:hypothetical protein